MVHVGAASVRGGGRGFVAELEYAKAWQKLVEAYSEIAGLPDVPNALFQVARAAGKQLC